MPSAEAAGEPWRRKFEAFGPHASAGLEPKVKKKAPFPAPWLGLYVVG